MAAESAGPANQAVQIQGQGVVVTGAGRGIGRAIAGRMAAQGAEVVVNDLDSEAVDRVAEEIGGYAVPGDAATEDGVTALLAAARERLGTVDVYFANAGVDVGRGLDSPEQDWARAFEVNVMAHVRAARELVPAWLTSGGGRFVVTASAAGLLTMLGGAPYSVTKHAAVAFAEWLSATYGHRGVTVQVICPQGVRTRMLDGAGPLQEILSHDTALEPEQVADTVWHALQDDRFLILPHPEVADYYALRASDTERWLAGMRKLQRRLDAAQAPPDSADENQ
ncbi:MAG TPA: SDR family oxidoreductase [Nocardioidaceae bacterium]|jgi:NAD(P)-dependent dehydrogenase (short-subunit alcohol dehydrogenase family)